MHCSDSTHPYPCSVAQAFKVALPAQLLSRPLAQSLSPEFSDSQSLLTCQSANVSQIRQAPLDQLIEPGLWLSEPHCSCCRNAVEIERSAGTVNQLGPRFDTLLLYQVEYPVTQLRLSKLLILRSNSELEARQIDLILAK